MSETQTLGPCTECGTPRDACTGPDYCCDECLHFAPDWEGYGPTSVTAPVPAGPTDAQGELLRTLRTHRPRTGCFCRCGWEGDDVATHLFDVTLPPVRAALDAQEVVTAVRELHTRDATVPYACEYCGQAWPCDVIHALDTAGDS